MQYRKIAGNDVSLLGYGCMRFPQKGNKIDMEATMEQLLYGYKKGINYFDTAYLYHGGKSEVILGQFIKKNDLRSKIYIADKLPCYLITKPEQIEKYFSTQLRRLDTDYIDYYLMHMLDSYKTWESLKAIGIEKFIQEKKDKGEIKHIGFSFHGPQEEFMKIVEDYPWEFCQIQYNYLDENYQAGTMGLKRAYVLGVDVVIMEPLRGGSLAHKAPKKVLELFKAKDASLSAAQWGLRWIFNQEEVSVVLSGMNDIAHIDENVATASATLPLSMKEDELSTIEKAKGIYTQLMKVPCTACGYCMPCPQGIDIPMNFSDYNSINFFGPGIAKYQYLMRAVMHGSGGDKCVSCGKCTKHCPQSIDIPHELKQAHKALNNRFLSGGLKIGHGFMNRKKAKSAKKLKKNNG